MPQFNKKNKIQTIYDIQIQNDIDLTSKKNKPLNQKNKSLIFKKPKDIYDSGWISVTGTGTPYTSVCTPNDANAFGQLIYQQLSSVISKPIPIMFHYNFIQDVNIPQELVPFIKASLMIKPDPTLNPAPVDRYKISGFGDDYYHIETNAGLVYQGYDPFTLFHSDAEINNGDILQSNCSKWYSGTVDYTDGVDNYRIEGSLVSFQIYYNMTFVAAVNDYNYTHFFTEAIDNLSGSSITGQGSEYTHTWEQDPTTHIWTLNQSDVHHEVHRTLNVMDSNNSVEMTIFGANFKNGDYQGSGWYSVMRTGNKPPSGWNTNANITSFNMTRMTAFDDPGNLMWKLFYSSRRLAPLQLNFNNTFSNLSTIDYVDTGASLPFNSITLKVNPPGYPTTAEDNFLWYYQPSRQQAWARITPEDAKKETWRFFMTGFLFFSAPGIVNYGANKDFIDETYSFNGAFFDRDSENRDPKQVPWYAPASHTVQMRLILTLVNPSYHQGIQRYKQ